MTLQKTGALAGFVCTATYLFGFALLVTVLSPLGFGSAQIDVPAVIDFIGDRPGLLIAWNSVIYILNGLALVVLVLALHDRLRPHTPGWAEITRAFGLIWATLVLGAGMIANVAIERAAQLAPTNPEAAADMWQMLHAVELGLGGGNEIAGGAWIASLSLAGLLGRSLGKLTTGLGIVIGLSGLATLIPSLGEGAGVLFGLGAIIWFIAVAIALLRPSPATPPA